jgi:hypothetical protein
MIKLLIVFGPVVGVFLGCALAAVMRKRPWPRERVVERVYKPTKIQ